MSHITDKLYRLWFWRASLSMDESLETAPYRIVSRLLTQLIESTRRSDQSLDAKEYRAIPRVI